MDDFIQEETDEKCMTILDYSQEEDECKSQEEAGEKCKAILETDEKCKSQEEMEETD